MQEYPFRLHMENKFYATRSCEDSQKVLIKFRKHLA